MINKIGKIWLIVGMVCLTSLSSFAGTYNQSETSYAFQKNVSVQTLSAEEMAAIEGEWFFLAPIIFSAISYTATSYASGTFAWAGLAWAAGSGLMGGGIYGSVGRAAGYAPYLFKGIGVGIGTGLNYSNPWKNGW